MKDFNYWLKIAGGLIAIGIAYGVATTQLDEVKNEHNDIFQEVKGIQGQLLQLQIDIQKLKDHAGIQ